MLNRAKGDVLKMAKEGIFDIVVHGCNCMNAIKSGFAKQVRELYYEAVEADNATVRGDRNKLGNFTECITKDNFILVNAYTQYDMNNMFEEFRDRFEYESFETILNKLAEKYGDQHFGLPYIGCGLAGGDEKRIIKIVEDFAAKVTASGGAVTLVEYAQ